MSDRPPDPLGLVGRTVAHFRILEPLGTGGMAVLYRAEDVRLGRTVALKFPAPHWSADETVKRRFLREARAAAALDHPNICAVYEAGETEEGLLFLAMPHYEGETLKERLERGPLSIDGALDIAVRVARGLAVAHAAGIVHRDVKPANLMLTADGEVKILDFGVAKLTDSTRTGSGGTPGTVAYMAPEQLRGEDVDARADLWALGVVLYEMLTARRPFIAEHPLLLLRTIEERAPEPPRKLRPDVPELLEGIVLRLLAKRPEERFPDAKELLGALGSGERQPAFARIPAGRRRGGFRRVAPLADRIAERKLVQWALAYLAAAFFVLGAIEIVAESFVWPEVVLQGMIVLVLAGLPAVLILGWYHGEKGRQSVSVTEAVLLGVVAVAAGVAIRGVGAASPMGVVGVRGMVGGEELDTARYLVLPFRGQEEMPDLRPDLLLHDALARWRGIELVDLFQVQDEIAAREGRPLTAGEERRIARSLAAGRLVRGDFTRIGATVRLHVGLLDTGTGKALADTTVQFAEGATLHDSVFTAVAAALLFGRGATPGATAEIEPGTRSYPARIAYLKGQEALLNWDLERADSLFALAIEHDPEYHRAYLWRAQVLNWNGRGPSALVTLAERATTGRERLTDRERRLGDALLHMARGEFAESCRVYEELRRVDDRDFAAWYGLGECHARDEVVVPSSRSPSGWAFRSSYHRAVEAYRRAFELLPAVHLGFRSRTFERVRELMYTSTMQARGGFTLPEMRPFAGRPALIADTLAFTPYPLEDFARARPGTRPSSTRAAAERQRRMFHQIASRWARAYPTSPAALEALALSLELLGDKTALDTIRRARAMASDPLERRQIAVEEIKLLVKFGAPDDTASLSRAQQLADSVFSSSSEAPIEDPAALAVVAALVGRVHDAARLARSSAKPEEWTVPLPVAVTGPAEALLAYSAFPGTADSIDAYWSEVSAALRHRLPPGEEAAALSAFLPRHASLAFMEQPPPDFDAFARAAAYPLLRAQGAFARGDTSAARETLLKMRESRRDLRGSEVSPEAVFPEAWLWVALGDTALAVATLDSTLLALRWLEPGHLNDVARAASVMRAMVLRAEIAAASRDSAVAARWSRAVALLWREADSVLYPIVHRMMELGGADFRGNR